MVRKNCRLLSLVMSIELGNIVYLHIILDAIPKADRSIINLSSTLFIIASNRETYMR